MRQIDRRIDGISAPAPLPSNHGPIARTYLHSIASVSSATLSDEQQTPRRERFRKISLSADSRRRLRLSSAQISQRCRVCRRVSTTTNRTIATSPPPPPHRGFVTESRLQYYAKEKLDPVTLWMSDPDHAGLLARSLSIISGRMICRHKNTAVLNN